MMNLQSKRYLFLVEIQCSENENNELITAERIMEQIEQELNSDIYNVEVNTVIFYEIKNEQSN